MYTVASVYTGDLTFAYFTAVFHVVTVVLNGILLYRLRTNGEFYFLLVEGIICWNMDQT